MAHHARRDSPASDLRGHPDTLSLRGVLQLHLSLFLRFLRPFDALEPVHGEFETADLVRASARGMPPMVLLNTARAVRNVFGARSYSFHIASEAAAVVARARRWRRSR